MIDLERRWRMSRHPISKIPLVMSYLAIRKTVGCLGIALPFVLAFGGMLLHGLVIQECIRKY
jgi:hypothetical protein